MCTLKCDSITNVSLEHYMEVLLDNNIKQAESEKKNILWTFVLSSFSTFHTKKI